MEKRDEEIVEIRKVPTNMNKVLNLLEKSYDMAGKSERIIEMGWFNSNKLFKQTIFVGIKPS